MELNPNTLERLRHVSTATLCTQLYKRGFRNVYIQGISRLTTPSGGNLVGPAFTMRNIPSREDLDQISAFDNPEHPQRKAIESVPPGHVLVLDCRGEKRVAPAAKFSPRVSRCAARRVSCRTARCATAGRSGSWTFRSIAPAAARR